MTQVCDRKKSRISSQLRAQDSLMNRYLYLFLHFKSNYFQTDFPLPRYKRRKPLRVTFKLHQVIV